VFAAKRTHQLPKDRRGRQREGLLRYIWANTAPEELSREAIARGEYPPNLDGPRAEVFSIGLTILASGVLEDCQRLYCGYDSLNEKLLTEFLSIFREKYSNYLFTTVLGMLTLTPQTRRSASDIHAELYPHE
jgi:hypothetical protein